MRALSPQFTELGVRILGVSFDPPERNKRFAKEEGFPFPLLSDTDRTLATRVGAARSEDSSMARRISYLIDGAGKVVRVYDDVDPATHARQVLDDCAGKTGSDE